MSEEKIICPQCNKSERVLITQTKIERRFYKCLDCQHEWQDIIKENEVEEFNG